MAFRTNKTPVLQEKSDSGSVATFNTALAMPLASCNIAVNAWQEGSGDPSPSNVRAIHGFSEVNATRAGKNLCNSVSENSIYYIDAYTNYTISDNAVITTGNTLMGFIIPVLPNTTYTLSFVRESAENSEIRARQYSKIPSDWSDGYISQSSGVDRITVTTGATTKALLMVVYATSANRFSNWQCEVGSTPTAYEPYVTPTIYTKQLGETVYGGSYNSVSGVKRKTWEGKKIKDLSNFSYVAPSAEYPYGYISMAATGKKPNLTNVKCDCFKTASGFSNNNSIMGTSSNIIIYVVTDTISSKEEFLSTYGDYMVMFELLTPIETDIGATPISTNIGNNTIFADTGDIDLTYKDLDIAKRGNFREVFKLPS